MNWLKKMLFYKESTHDLTYSNLYHERMFLNWNHIQAALRQWKSILQPEANHSLNVNTIGY